jgi:hypothetical protein
MLIELTIRRPVGTHVQVLGTDYHFFEREPGGPHVDDVNDPAHIEHFLSIKAFRPAEVQPVATAPETTTVVIETPQEPVRRGPGRPRKVIT